MARVSFFIDGFNVYHSLKDKRKYNKFLWLDYRTFLQKFVRKRDILADIFYFSAYAHWLSDKAKRHKLLVDAWQDTGVTPVMGDFKEKHRFCNNCRTYFKSHEEKQTDVNIGIYLIKEAYEDSYDTAILFTNDTDLVPAIKMLKSTFPAKRVGVLFPIDRWSSELYQVCHFKRMTRKKLLSKSQFPDTITLPSGKTFNRPNPDKPETWPQRHKDTKQNCLLKFIFVFWCLGGEYVLPQNTQK